jgi:DNA-binding CsgD family transcriptional regulator
MLLMPLAAKYPELIDEVPPLTEVLKMTRTTGQTIIRTVLLPMLAVDATKQGDIARAAAWCTEGLELSGEASLAAGYGLMAAVEIAAARGDNEYAARFHGMLRRSLRRLSANMPPEYLETHEAVLRRVGDSLGFDAMEASAARGAQVAWRDAVDEARGYTRAVAASEMSPPVVRPAPNAGHVALTARQFDVVRLLAQGLTNKEIGERLALTPKTVMHHTGDVYRRLGVRGRSEAVAFVIRTGMLD